MKTKVVATSGTSFTLFEMQPGAACSNCGTSLNHKFGLACPDCGALFCEDCLPDFVLNHKCEADDEDFDNY